MDTLIIQDSFAPYYAGKDHGSAPEKKPAKRWLTSRGEDEQSQKQTAATDRRAGA